MEKEIIQIGQSLAVILPRQIAKTAGIHKGDIIKITANHESIKLKPTQKLTPVKLRGIIPRSKVTETDLKKVKKQITSDLKKKWKNM